MALPDCAIENAPPAPPTNAPSVPEYARGEETVGAEVATLAKVFAPEKYGMFPMTAAVEVESPLKVKAPVVELYARGKAAERLDEDILLLNTVQSVEER